MLRRLHVVSACLAAAIIILVVYPPSYRVRLWDSRESPPARSQRLANDADAIRPPPSRIPSPQPDAAAALFNFTTTDRPLQQANDRLCTQLPGQDRRIAVIIKTGASEVFAKMPTQIQTVLRCIPDFFIFSDLEQTVAGVHIRDSLDGVLDSVKTTHQDFALYNAQRRCHDGHVSQGACTRFRDTGKEGWNLDKYKNIHIAEKVYNINPGYDWHVVIDADSYLFWTTLVEFLSRLDSSKTLLMGSRIFGANDLAFAHGGSGYIVSRAALDELVGRNPGIGNKYDHEVSGECCGDLMFAKALSETSGVQVAQGVCSGLVFRRRYRGLGKLTMPRTVPDL
jgi:hypothetical protein